MLPKLYSMWATEDIRWASRRPIGPSVSILLFVSAVGALVTEACGAETDGSASFGDEVGNTVGHAGAGFPDASASGAGGDGGTREGGGGSVAVASSTGFTAVAVGEQSTYAIRDQAVYRLDERGPSPVEGLASGVTAIAAATEQACAIADGGAVCWGSFVGNWYNEDEHSVPAPVEGLTTGVSAISTNAAYYGLDSVCAVVSGGVTCWGWSYGSGMNSDHWSVVQVPGLASGVSAIATAGYHSCAVVDGGARCWGDNERGQLGNGTTIDSSVPVQVEGLTSGVSVVGVGGRSSCAIVDDGIWCWGARANASGGAMTDSSVPVQVEGLTFGVTAIAVGFSHACAVIDGGAKCWGENHAGQLGDGTTTSSAAPVQVEGLTSGVTAIAAGFERSCAIVSGSVVCWGNDEPTPAKVTGT